MSFFRVIFVIVLGLSASACVRMTLAWADLKPKGAAATPAVLAAFDGDGPVETTEDWAENRAPKLRAAFEKNVYGAMPDRYDLRVLENKLLDAKAFNGMGVLTEYALQAEVNFGERVQKTDVFFMDIVSPLNKPDAPVILMQTFCPRWDTIPHPAVQRPEGADGCGGSAIFETVGTFVFGRYIATPPIEDILRRGYALATIYPSEFAPDNDEKGLAALSKMAAGQEDVDMRWGAIAAWAWGYSLMIDALQSGDGLDDRAYIAYGHSRYGKSALLAGAFDERVAGVIAHQSGTGGASLNREKPGESISSITENYPHWFSTAYAKFAGREEALPVDQHQLLALIAPRPVLLGNARRDVWSDPNGAFRAAIGADAVYELFGKKGLDQSRLNEWRPDAELAFWIRPGTHGVVEEDWPAFLSFLDAHFKVAQ